MRVRELASRREDDDAPVPSRFQVLRAPGISGHPGEGRQEAASRMGYVAGRGRRGLTAVQGSDPRPTFQRKRVGASIDTLRPTPSGSARHACSHNRRVPSHCATAR
jgi:hypothetical protein